MASTSERRRQFFKSFEAKSLKSRSILTQIADDLTSIFGSTGFLILNAIFFAQWIVINLGMIPSIKPWDPFPFGLLTMILSIEAIFLAIFILVSQNRSSYISSLREEVHLQVNLIAEEEITKVLQLLAEMRREMGVKKKDSELEMMLKRIDTNYIENRIISQMENAKNPVLSELLKEFPELMVKKPVEILEKPLEEMQSLISPNAQTEAKLPSKK